MIATFDSLPSEAASARPSSGVSIYSDVPVKRGGGLPGPEI